MTYIKGIDISHWQANIDFAKLAKNDIRFAIFKAGEVPTGSRREFTDGKYERNISEAAKHGIISGAYYFFHPSIGASRQARHFATVMDNFGHPDLPPVIDVEVNDNLGPPKVASALKGMIDALLGRGYRAPIIYSRWGFLVNQVGEPFWIKDHLLWLAQYNSQLVNKPADMSKVIIWQFTDRLQLPGIGVDLDGNYWLKSEEELIQLAHPPLLEDEQTAAQPPEQNLEQVAEQFPGQPVEQIPEQVMEQFPEQPVEQPPEQLPDLTLAQPPQPSQPSAEPLPDPLPERQPVPPTERPDSSASTPGFWWLFRQMIQSIMDALKRFKV